MLIESHEQWGRFIADMEKMGNDPDDLTKAQLRDRFAEWKSNDWTIIGNDLRASCDGAGGFNHVTLRDADDGDVIVVNEDDLEALRDYLDRIIQLTKAECRG